MWQLLWDFETSGSETLEFLDLGRFGLFGLGFVSTWDVATFVFWRTTIQCSFLICGFATLGFQDF